MEVVPLHTITIRQAQIHDLPEIVGCGLQFWKEMPWVSIRPHPDPVYIAEWLMKLDGNSNMMVACDEEIIIGLCGGTIVPFPMIADLPYLWEWVWWVHPEYRHTDTARRLWRALTEWAKEEGAKGCVYGKPEAQTTTTMKETLQWRWWL